jgi:sulfite dehydrogenase (quinone) subunit SoeC
MHPAFSVIFFTVTSGLGYGLVSLLIIAGLIGFGDLGREQLLYGSAAAIIFITLGLLSSTLHLANPKNAWRAMSRFRTSWLSREGVFAILFYPIILLYLYAVWVENTQLTLIMGIISVFLAMITVFSTGMIYACLKTIRQWNTALTPANYLTLGLMLGGLFLASIHNNQSLVNLAMALIVLAAVNKLMYYAWISEPTGPSINTATGFTNAVVRILETGHTAGTFLTQEFGHHISQSFMLRSLVFGLGFILPLILLALSTTDSVILVYIATISAYIGILVERWLFFAEARHVVNLYHGEQRT